MALSRIGASAADGTTITIPAGHQNGDLIVIYAFRNALTAPSLPAGWTAINNGSAGSSAYRIGWKLAGSASETSGTWTNATGLMVVVYRSTATNKSPIGANIGQSNLASTNTSYNTLTLQSPNSSLIVAFAGNSTNTSNVQNAPTGLTSVVNTVGAACEYVIFDSNGLYPSGVYSANTVANGVSSDSRTHLLEIKSELLGPLNNYQFIKVGDGMGTGERIR